MSLTRAEIDEYTGEAHKVARIFGNWVCWPTKKNPLVTGGYVIDFAYFGKSSTNNGFAYRDGNIIRTPNDWGCHPPKRMMEYLERNLPK